MTNLADPVALTKLNSDFNLLALKPTDINLQTSILKQQVDITTKQLGVSPTEGANVVKGIMAATIVSKGADPQEVMQALTTEQQNILNYSKTTQTLYGVSLPTALKLSGYLGLGSGVLLTASLTLFAIALFTVGPEAAAAITAGEGVVATIGLALGNSTIAFGGFLFLLSQFVGHLSTNIPATVKQIQDVGSIGPGLRVTALKNIQELQDKYAGTASPGSFTSGEFTSYATALESAGIVGMNNPAKGQTQLYSRANLAQIVIYFYGQAIKNGTPSTPSKLKPVIAPYLIYKNKAATAGSTTTPFLSPQPANTSGGGTSAPSTKVFSGVVSSGTVGSDLTFTPRPDDLIENMGELQDAINNNVAPFLAALASKVTYEIKVVSSIIVGGIKKTGQAQTVQSGTYANGTPKLKTVVNKFAVVDLYILTDKNTRSKITTIVLGPTNSLTFSPTGDQLSLVASDVASNVITTNTDDISHVVSNTPTTTSTPTPKVAANPQGPRWLLQTATGGNYVGVLQPNGVFVPDFPPDPSSLDNLIMANPGASGRTSVQAIPGTGATNNPIFTIGAPPANSAGVSPPNASNPPQGNQPSASVTPTSALPASALTAQTLSEFYGAFGRQLPSLEDRGRLYQSLGLGQAAFYAGTAEQNTKLLNSLKITGI